MAQYTLQQLFAITAAVCTCNLQHAPFCLISGLKDLNIGRISWPSREATCEYYGSLIKQKYPLLEKCIGFIDGLNLPVNVADNKDNILTFAPDGTIIHAILNVPGSWHNSTIAERLYGKLMNKTPPGYQVISDTAFQCCTDRLDYRILAPMKRGDWLPEDPVDFARLKVLNKQLVSARQAAEWGMHAIQGLFSRLKLPLPPTDHEFREEFLELCVRLHQVRCWSVHINQTQIVYQAVEDEHVILGRLFHQMLFPDSQRRCWISRYYHGWL
ncbi:hypothetical protein PTTG_00052 [Puccinia triticina 1-1 BBBD Race 1]|uniref:DDE Tnp4 domain-containing protein n=1 Tax=Puccinia triticina (isolate 1-1 / race 1 (BBBD)) TaxID=630390 RepID=A0A180GP47_PUCT1|nr:hypothetical protein PTTG_00052 [Puccinia triticina 1-1 BBBD Race 1]